MRYLLATITMMLGLSAQAQERTGVWSYADELGGLSVRLNANGTCSITVRHKASGREDEARCTYWIHGSRVRIRVPGQRDGDGFNRLDIEHDPASNTLIVHGDKPRTLKRDAPYDG